MYPISEALRTRFENGERKRVTITLNNLTLKDLIITDADIVSDSLSIDRYCATGNKIEIGSAVSAELSLVLNNDDGKFDGIKFEGSELKVEMGIWGVANSDIPCGYFTVDEPPRAFSKIRLKALDFMMRFDKEADLTKIPFPCSVETVVRTISSLCDVVVSENINFDGFPNSRLVLYAPTTPNITYRQILQWVAQITGTCAYIDWDGKLRLSWIKSTIVNITPAIRYSGDMLENDISITGVVVKTGNGSFVSGTEDYALDIDGNELIRSGAEQQTASNVFNGVNGFKYRPYECSCVPMPYLYPLDKIIYTDKKGNVIDTIITNHTFGLNSVSALAAQGETQQKKSYASQTNITKKEIDKAIAEAMKGVDLTAEKFYVKYSPYNGGKDANGNIVWSVTVMDDTVYIGTCATTESTAPTDPTKYNWVRLKGVDGDSISNVKNYYLATASASGVTTSTSGWTEAVQTPTSAKKYLWNYEEIIYTGNKTATKTAPCIIGVFGADGKGITTITEYYLASASSSGVTTGTSGWSTDMQITDSAKKYLWNYETITYTDGSASTTTPVIIGVHGEKGDTGVGISTVKNYYLASSSSSGVTTSTSGWSDNVSTQTLSSTKKYLWNYEEVTYTGSTLQPTKTDPCIIGVFGADGKGISSITEYYLATSSSSGVTTSTNGWTTAVQTVTSDKKYLWNYEVIAYTSGNPTTTTPVIIGTYGEKGDPGKGISSVVNYYLASSSSSGVTTSTSGWTESVQTPTKDKKYLWNYEEVIYSDTSSTTTPPCIIGNFAEGADGTVVSIDKITEYYAKSSSQTTTPDDSAFSTSVPTLDATDKYLWNYEKIEYTGGKSATTTPKCVIGVFGKDGTSQYVYVRYSANSNGSSMTSSPQSNTAYMGVCTTTSSTAPTSYTNYTWTKIKGEQGVGIPGTSSYTHIKYSNNGTTFTDGNGEELGSWIGILVDTNETDSSVFSDYTWKKFTDDVDSTLNDLDDRINKAVADIIKLNDRLATLVTDENGYSLMQQTSDGWTFNIGDVTGNVEKVAGDLKDLSDDFNGIVSSVDGLSDAIDDLGELASYVRVIQDNNKPCIELGKSDSDFKVKITNTDIKFMEGSTVVAYISNQALNIEKAVIKEEMQVGGFAFKKRSNGNVGFMWKGES